MVGGAADTGGDVGALKCKIRLKCNGQQNVEKERGERRGITVPFRQLPKTHTLTKWQLRGCLVEDEAEDWVQAIRQGMQKRQLYSGDTLKEIQPVAKASEVWS